MRRRYDFVQGNNSLHAVHNMVNLALKNIEPLLSGMYVTNIKGGRASIAPEKLLLAMLLQNLYSIRSERLLMEQTKYNLLFRWFVGPSMEDTVWVSTVFTKNRERLDVHDTGNFKGKKRSIDTHVSTTEADARLFQKGKTGSELDFMGNTLSDNRHGAGYAEREAAKEMIADAQQVADKQAKISLGADKGYDAAEFIVALTEMKALPHVTQNNANRRSAVPDHIAATGGYFISQQKGKLLDQGFGWAKFIGPIRQVMVCGLKKVDQLFVLTMLAYNHTLFRTLAQIRLLTT